MMRQGPHQGAQKSTSTGFSDSSTSAWKLRVGYLGDVACHCGSFGSRGRYTKSIARPCVHALHASAQSAGTFQTASSAIRARHLRGARPAVAERRSAPPRRGSRPGSPGRSSRSGSRSRRRGSSRSIASSTSRRKHLKPPVRSRTGTPSTIGRTSEPPRLSDPAHAAPQSPRRRRARSASRARGRRRAAASIRRGRSAGSWEKSASISSTRSAPRGERALEAGEVGAARGPPWPPVQHLDRVELGGEPVGDLARCRRASRRPRSGSWCSRRRCASCGSAARTIGSMFSASL